MFSDILQRCLCPTCVRHFRRRGDWTRRRRASAHRPDDRRRRGVFPQDLRGVPSGGSYGGAPTPGVVVVRAHSRIRHGRERKLVKDGERLGALIARRREPRELKFRGVHHRLEHGEVRWQVGVVLGYVGDLPGQAPGPRRNVVQSDDAARLAHPADEVHSPGDDVEEGALAGAAGAEQTEELPAAARSGDAVEKPSRRGLAASPGAGDDDDVVESDLTDPGGYPSLGAASCVDASPDTGASPDRHRPERPRESRATPFPTDAERDEPDEETAEDDGDGDGRGEDVRRRRREVRGVTSGRRVGLAGAAATRPARTHPCPSQSTSIGAPASASSRESSSSSSRRIDAVGAAAPPLGVSGRGEKVVRYLPYARRGGLAAPADLHHAADAEPAALLEREEVLQRARLERHRVRPGDAIPSLGESQGHVAHARVAEVVALNPGVARHPQARVEAEVGPRPRGTARTGRWRRGRCPGWRETARSRRGAPGTPPRRRRRRRPRDFRGSSPRRPFPFPSRRPLPGRVRRRRHRRRTPGVSAVARDRPGAATSSRRAPSMCGAPSVDARRESSRGSPRPRDQASDARKLFDDP